MNSKDDILAKCIRMHCAEYEAYYKVERWEGTGSFNTTFAPRVREAALFPFRICDYGSCGSECCTSIGNVRARPVEVSDILGRWPEVKPYLEERNREVPPDKVFVPLDLAKTNPNSADDQYSHKIKEHGNGLWCFFLSPDKQGIYGCSLHRHALENGIPWRAAKPAPCSIYPLLIKERRSRKFIEVSGRRNHKSCYCLKEVRPERQMPLIIYKVGDMAYWLGETFTKRIFDACWDKLISMYGSAHIDLWTARILQEDFPNLVQ